MSVTLIGEALIDLIVPAYSVTLGETYHRRIEMFVGGLSNIALQISNLGEEAKFVGKVGNDPYGEYIRESLKQNGVKDLLISDPKAMTGLCVSLVYENGERTMIASRKANDNLDKGDIERYLAEIKNSKIVYFSGYSMLKEKVRTSVLKCIEDCHKEEIKIYFNPGTPNIIGEKFKEIIRDFVDVLILNQDEARILIGKSANLQSLSDFARLAVVTRGSDGCTIVGNGKISDVKTNKIIAKNTTGAGDAFAAGFIVGKLRGISSVECAKLGNETAKSFMQKKKGEIFK